MIPGDTPVKPEENGDSANDEAPGAAPQQAEPQLAPELTRIIAAWPSLPEAIRRAMLALIG